MYLAINDLTLATNNYSYMKTTHTQLSYKMLFALLILLLPTIFATAQTTRVLFIGNSLTGVNNLPNQFESLAISAGKQIYVEDATIGGATLQDHLNNTTTINKIQQGNWDYVVLQEQSQLPSWETDREFLFYPYAKSLDSIIKIYNPCGATMFFMTYAHRNGDLGILQNGGYDTYWDMQQRIREGYMEIADSLNSPVSPVGWAFRQCRLQYPNIELYMPDFNHPTDTGTYLAACTFYSTIFQDSSIGLPYIGNMTNSKALILQSIASKIVLDSMSLWNISSNTVGYATSNFNFSDSLLTVSYNNMSTNALNYYWDFGDNNHSIIQNPVHTYSSSGLYNVKLIASNNCNSDTNYRQISILDYNTPPICNFGFTSNNNAYSFIDSSHYAVYYSWDFGDGDTSNSINPTHVYNIANTYSVKLKVTNIFGSDSITKMIIINPNGINDNKNKPKIEIYPNPLQNTLNIRTNIENYSTQIRSINNVLLYNSTESRSSKTDISKLPNGIYILTIHTKEGIYTHRLLIAN
ncbi:MAG: hypothetical protein B6I18_08545 [Bacteroidetes bacterium 4572_112]|nr:MAG: hypothetical protein B6I18_08545 [Bacteroidetes bacterium 4572_112]